MNSCGDASAHSFFVPACLLCAGGVSLRGSLEILILMHDCEVLVLWNTLCHDRRNACRYYRPSIIQPELIESMRSGAWKPPPPPPPGATHLRRESVSSALYSIDMHASHASTLISPSPRRRSSSLLNSSSLDVGNRGASTTDSRESAHGGLGVSMHMHGARARSNHGIGDSNTSPQRPSLWGDSGSYACTQNVPAWEPIITNQQINQVPQSQRIDAVEWPALGPAKPGSPLDTTISAAAQVSTGATSTTAVSTGANGVNHTSVGSVQLDNTHMHARHAHSGISVASDHSCSTNDAWCRSSQACAQTFAATSNHDMSIHAAFPGRELELLPGKDEGQAGVHGGDGTFSGALPGDLLEDSDLHGTPWELPRSAKAAYGVLLSVAVCDRIGLNLHDPSCDTSSFQEKNKSQLHNMSDYLWYCLNVTPELFDISTCTN